MIPPWRFSTASCVVWRPLSNAGRSPRPSWCRRVPNGG